MLGPEAASSALIPLPWYDRHWPENPSMPACSSIHSALCKTETISQPSHSGINKTSCWHESVPEGITRLVSTFTSPPCWMSLKFAWRLCYYEAVPFSHYYRRYCRCFAFLFIYFIIIMIFSFHTRSGADPPGSFNSTITQHSTISARASAGRIRVT